MADKSPKAQIFAGKAAILWQRVEDNAFHLYTFDLAGQGCANLASSL
jgi:hypothetical protein